MEAVVRFSSCGKNRYRLERTPKMRTEAIFYANEALLPQVSRDRSLLQLQETACLPDLMSPVLGMPDLHQGYGIPVGGIIASSKIVSAGCVGMDINCGVRLLATELEATEKLLQPNELKRLINLICRRIPVGVGKKTTGVYRELEIDKVISAGAEYLVVKGYGSEDDLKFCEENGRMAGALPNEISATAKARAGGELGSLGGGNHFIDIQVVEKIFDDNTAKSFGLAEGQICVMIHSGSRAVGHQTCLDYVDRFWTANRRQQPELIPNRQLASALVDSAEGRDYLAAMAGAANFGFANRQMMTHQIRLAMADWLGPEVAAENIKLVYDIGHNSAKWETHRGQKVLVHRKGATRALPPGPGYHPALVPGSMGTASYVLAGTPAAAETYFSVNHGAGRAMSRTQAKREIRAGELRRRLGRVILNQPAQKVLDEAPMAYKDIEAVIETLAEIGVTRRIAKLKPVAVIAGA